MMAIDRRIALFGSDGPPLLPGNSNLELSALPWKVQRFDT